MRSGLTSLPAVPLVQGAEHAVAGDPQLARVPARIEDGERPLEAVAVLGWRGPHAVRIGPDADDPLLARPVVVADHSPHAGPAADRAPDDDGRIAGLHREVAALAAARLEPVDRGDGAAVGLARQTDGPVVLLRAVHAVRALVVGAHVVELRGRLVVDRRPRLPAVERHAGAAVVSLDHPSGVRRIDPEVVVVAVRGGDLAERLAAVDGLPQAIVRHPYRVDVDGIGEDVHVVPGTPAKACLLAAPLPGGAAVVGAEERAVLGLDHGVDTPAVGRRDDDADAPQDPAREPRVSRDVSPGLAAVGRLPQRRLRPSARHAPRRALRLPDGRVERARVVRVHREVDRAGAGTLEQHVVPPGAAIAGPEDAALGIRTPRVSERGDVDQIGVVRVHADAADVARVAEPDVRPRDPPVSGSVDAVAVRHVAADARFTGAGVDDAGIGRRDRERTDGRGLEEAVGYVLPVGTAVGGLPDAAGAGAEVERHRVGRMARDRDHTTTAMRSDQTPLERVEQPRVDGHGVLEVAETRVALRGRDRWRSRGAGGSRPSQASRYAITRLMNLSGGRSPHWETSPSSAEIKFEPFFLFRRSVSDQCSCTRPHGSDQ